MSIHRVGACLRLSFRSQLLMLIGLSALADIANAQSPVKSCDSAGMGVVVLTADGSKPTITSVSTGTANARGGGSGAGVSYCLIKVLVPQAINIWVTLPMGNAWNGRWQSVGGGVYAGAVSV